jgi:hypothetical protein
MSLTPSINFVCQRALRLIGEYALRASGPRPEAMEEATYWLDMQMGFVSAMELTWWLVPATATFPLVAGQRDYTLMDVIGQEQAPDGIQFVSALFVDDATTGAEVGQVNLLRRHEFEEALGQNANAEGPPSLGHIDRQRNPTLRFVEAPDTATAYRARVVFQSYSPDLTATKDLRKLATFRDGWTLYLVYALAAHLASGAVRRLPSDEVRQLEGKAKEYLYHLQAHDGHEAQTEHRVRFHNLG